jgi:hypothetical protein
VRIFISWSGIQSKLIAEALKEWLPTILHSTDTWLSSKDIDKGARWLDEMNTQLKDSRFGIVCLTRENVNERWIHFEAGAIARAIAADQPGRVWTYLIGLKDIDVQGPSLRL